MTGRKNRSVEIHDMRALSIFVQDRVRRIRHSDRIVRSNEIENRTFIYISLISVRDNKNFVRLLMLNYILFDVYVYKKLTSIK